MNHVRLAGATKTFFPHLFLVMTVLFFLAACLPRDTTAPPITLTAPSEYQGVKRWHVRFNMSGGFAGLQRFAELSSTGQMTVTESNRQVSVQVPQFEMDEISSWVIQAQPLQSQPRLSNCRDCFEYELTIFRDGEMLFFWFNDITLENAELAPLVYTLGRLLEQALSGQLAPVP